MTASNSPSVLIIEDDEFVRQTLVDILELNDFEVMSASNGIDGLALARERSPTLAITDIAMPGMDGYALLECFHHEPALRTIPIIVITAAIDRAAVRRGMELGADDFIPKPFTETEVLRSIRTRLEKKALLDELDAFAHTVAHDLKNPLSALMWRLNILEGILKANPDTSLREQVTEASVAARRLDEIIDEMLILSGVRRQSVTHVLLDTGKIVHDALGRLEDLLRNNRATVHVPSEWPQAAGHPAWVAEIWTNYISNAAKYGGREPRIELGSGPSRDGTFTRFWVQDHGPGLDAAAQSRLFIEFSRISTVRASGHGLGLSIVRRIMEKLGGAAGVESTPGAGARFWFELPREVAKGGPVTHSARAAA